MLESESFQPFLGDIREKTRELKKELEAFVSGVEVNGKTGVYVEEIVTKIRKKIFGVRIENDVVA